MGMLCSSSAFIIPIWARPFAPPPLSTSPTRWAWENSGTSKRIIYITSLLKGMSFFKVKQILSKKTQTGTVSHCIRTAYLLPAVLLYNVSTQYGFRLWESHSC